MKNIFLLLLVVGLSFGCSKNNDTAVLESIDISSESVEPGTSVKIMGQSQKLFNEGGNIKVGKPIFKFVEHLKSVDFKRRVSIISFVPSIQTKVCEKQTHILGESGQLDPNVQIITISREDAEIQQEFSKKAKLTNITYLSDSKEGQFGELSGLLMSDKNLLARGVIVVDQRGIIQYLQVVPELTKLPDMKRAIEFANQLVEKLH